jgi:hypothetical protein
MNELITLTLREGKVSLALGINRDLFSSSDKETEEIIEFYRDMKASGTFDMIFELTRNLSGYTKDVHGQLNIISGGDSKQKAVKNVKFRLTENKVEVFEHFVI